ncbi:SUF system NifU family Fe-S cluster assembly protein [Actinotignum urinale]|uniref:SUF system NifU family Fe-S cluster assembly protein n=1 Tax=Actinotignum urinale TaxID=190146 RepID=A0AAW9HXC1_9ACTO|nr:SUF system NifU family Fe-S cluster assembly protein [Actinotignum urinale]MDY5128909.1 SUF system NifU family Fe-S cluster assembly protein [Actinotignum urinale]MDY5133124.1 SUF system NifU family Fe-S cluster assembly protein [Actinotignum urinale]MDY5152317.1 SUF system NifU family Fe-S cluster assembly protein [Actinotignum urinale]MDY5154466.1 SUF system NifU family Fe-S cluster assembly protein [Actinotignum urinale]MDY5160339.1 SUF system NifU family Fe-S cluster assembly protein [A
MNSLDDMYQDIILDAARERHGEGRLKNPDGESTQNNPVCGDHVTMQVQLSEDGNTIENIAWQGDGCSISQASISIMTELVEGKSVEDLAEHYAAFRRMMDSRGKDISEDDEELLEDAVAFLGVAKFPLRIKCALLGWMAVREATDEALEGKNHG